MSNLILFNFSESFEHERLDEHCKPYKTFLTIFKIYGHYDISSNDIKECWISIEVSAQRLIYFSLENWFRLSINIKLKNILYIEKILDLLGQAHKLPSNDGTITLEIPIHEGRYFGTIYYGYLAQSNFEDVKKNINYLNIKISKNGVVFYPISDEGIIPLKNMWVFPTIFYSTKDTHYCKDLKDDTNNYNRLLNFLEGVVRWFELARSPKILQVDLNQFDHLSNYEHGDEVLKHLQDALKCIEHRLFHPALNSFLHAIEWALIMGLKAKGKDIIDEERKDNKKLYYLKDLINEAHKHGLISDKMKDRLEIFSRNHRRWTAHHKTGEIIEDDIKSVVNLFKALIDEIEKNM